MEKRLLAVFLFLCHVCNTKAFPFPPVNSVGNTTEESGSGEMSGSGEVSGSGEMSGSGERGQTVTDSPPLNEYVQLFFPRQRSLKESDCTLSFLGQNVSKHLCDSNLIKIQFPQERSEADDDNGNTPTEGGFELCADAVEESLGEILGYDLVVYRRPSVSQDNSTQEMNIMITESVQLQGSHWVQVLGSLTIDRDGEGWQVIHLSTRINNRFDIPIFCFNMNVVTIPDNNNSTQRLLRRDEIQDMFILNDTRADERSRLPVVMVYIRKTTPPSGLSPFFPNPTNPFPLKRSVPQLPPGESQVLSSVQDYLSTLTDILHGNIIAVAADIDLSSTPVSYKSHGTHLAMETDHSSLSEGEVLLMCRRDNFTFFVYAHNHNDLPVDNIATCRS